MSQPRPQHSNTVGSSPATAKIRLLSQLLDQAARLNIPLAAQAVLTRIVVDTWWSPDDQAWLLRQRHDGTAARLGAGASVPSLRRHIDQLAQHGLLIVMPGNGQLATTYRLPAGWKAAPSTDSGGGDHRWAPPAPGVITRDHPGCSPVSTLPDTQSSHNPAAAGAVRPVRIGAGGSADRSGQLSAAAAGDRQDGAEYTRPAGLWGQPTAGAQRGPTRRQRAVAAALAIRPRWLRADQEWFEPAACMALALLPHVDRLHIWRVLRATHRALAGLRKPAAVVLTRLKRAPEPWETADEAQRQLDQYWSALQLAIEQLGVERIGIKHDPHAWLQRVEASNAVMQQERPQ